MIKIDESIIAIQLCQPKAGIFLKVVGTGSEQRLAAVKMNWFGRLLMWLGCSNASMTKVAKFIEQNMPDICKSRLINLQDGDNPLEKLVKRISKFSDRHPKRIRPVAEKIASMYAAFLIPMPSPAPIQTISLQLQTVPLSPVTPSQIVPVIPLKPVAPEPSLSRAVQTPQTLTPVKAALPPIPTFKPPQSVPPTTPQQSKSVSAEVQKAVDQFKTMRGHIVKVKDLLKGRSSGYEIGAGTELKNVREHLSSLLPFPDRFEAVINEMTVEEVGLYAAFDVADYAKNYTGSVQNARRVYQSVFSLTSRNKFDPNPMLEATVKAMSLDQLDALLSSILQWGGQKRKICALYNVLELIRKHKTPSDRNTLFSNFMSLPNADDFLLENWDSYYTGTKGALEQHLFENYLRILLKDPTTDAKIQRFLETTHVDGTVVHKSSILQNQTFLDTLSMDEQERVSLSLVTLNRNQLTIVESLLVANVLKAGSPRSLTLFKAFADHQHASTLFFNMENAVPGCDKDYILYLLRDQKMLNDYAEMKRRMETFLKHVSDNSALSDPVFIKTLTLGEIAALGAALVNTHPSDPSHVGSWEKVYFLREVVMKNSDYVNLLYSVCTSWNPKFDRFLIPRHLLYCIRNKVVLDALVKSMPPGDQQTWHRETNPFNPP